jgi:hypothetical protein
MILSNAKWGFTAPAIARWAAVRLAIYLGSAALTAVLFVSGAAFYSFVWPAPPMPSQIVAPSSPQAVPDRLPSASPASVDPDEAVKRTFSPNHVEWIAVSSLSWKQIANASIITIDDRRTYSTVGTPRVNQSYAKGNDFVLDVWTVRNPMSNDFGFATPDQFLMRASDLRWYTVQYPDRVSFFAVATREQVSAAMAKATK